jgi:Flp pilus assembly protein TadG
MKKLHLQRSQRARGQALTEFALVAPIFFLLVFSVIQLGILFGGQNGLVAAARELTRYAAPFRVKTFVDATNVCADTRLTKQLTSALKTHVVGYNAANTSIRSITYSWLPNPNGTYYVQLQVNLAYRFPLYVPLVSNILDGIDGANDTAFKLTATEGMRIENEDLTATEYSATPKTCTI